MNHHSTKRVIKAKNQFIYAKNAFCVQKILERNNHPPTKSVISPPKSVDTCKECILRTAKPCAPRTRQPKLYGDTP